MSSDGITESVAVAELDHQPSDEQQPATTPVTDEPMHPCGVPEGLFNSSRWRRVWEQLLAPLPEAPEGGGDGESRDVPSS